jgi:arylsulfatase
MTRFRAIKDIICKGGFGMAAITRWSGKVKQGMVKNRIVSGLDWLPTLETAVRNPTITDQILKGTKLGDRSYKSHLDGHNQMDLLLGKDLSLFMRFYFGRPHRGVIRIDDCKFKF